LKALKAWFGTDTKAFGNAGPKALHENVGVRNQPQHGRHPFGMAQINGNRLSSASSDVEGRGNATG
jgi:hypothetical protein